MKLIRIGMVQHRINGIMQHKCIIINDDAYEILRGMFREYYRIEYKGNRKESNEKNRKIK